MKARALTLLLVLASAAVAGASSVPVRMRNGMVVSQNAIASQVGVEVLIAGGNAMDAAVATAFTLAVVHPAAGNIGGGGFLLYRPAVGAAIVYDFREKAPTGAAPTMFLQNGQYSEDRHHRGHLSVGVPGTVAGLNVAWKEHGRLPWKQLLSPAIALARDGFLVSDGLARSLKQVLPRLRPYPASIAQFSRAGVPYEAGDLLQQPDLAKTLERIAERGIAGFYDGETARLVEREMKANGGLITAEDLKGYTVYERPPLSGTYRGYEVLTAPPPSGGGVSLLECLNVLEGYDLRSLGFGSADHVHLVAEALRRALADRARYLGDPEAVKDMPVERLVSKEYATQLRRSIRMDRASVSSPATFEWPAESKETTHFSVVDAERNVVAVTYTLEDSYGSKIVVPGAGFLLNNEMGDFNACPGLTDESGLVGTEPNLAASGKRMLSSMTPTIVVRTGHPYFVTGSPGGRTIPSTVLLTVLNVLDFGMNPQEAVDAPRFNHQWLPDVVQYERHGLSADTLDALRAGGHKVQEIEGQGVAEAILVGPAGEPLEGGCDRRAPDGAAIGR
jgi:gamma-glutamyltranspeptidase/glutathione hydrolase